ncbi:MAG TPA: hypothetical protein VFA55_06475 [Candidatus Kapabacteria bacterium]|nr:hypothetical protein [Candidatus Kapabacteria bacterium]
MKASGSVNDTLPYAQGKEKPEIEQYPQFGIGFGATWYSASFTPVNDALNAMASQYAKQGYTNIPTVAFKTPLLYWPSIGFRVSPHVLLLAEAGTAFFADVGFSAVSVNMLYRFYTTKVLGAYPFLHAGIGYYHFSIIQTNNIDSTGGTQQRALDDSVTAGSFGGIGGIGLEFNASLNVSWDFYADYLFVPALKGVTSDGTALRENLSGFLLGIRLKCFFI